MGKAAFVKKFSDFLIENVPYYSDVKSLVYVVDNDNNEWLYCNYKSYSQKRINVNCDSEQAIILDFINRIEDTDWIVPMDKEIYNK